MRLQLSILITAWIGSLAFAQSNFDKDLYSQSILKLLLTERNCELIVYQYDRDERFGLIYRQPVAKDTVRRYCNENGLAPLTGKSCDEKSWRSALHLDHLELGRGSQSQSFAVKLRVKRLEDSSSPLVEMIIRTDERRMENRGYARFALEQPFSVSTGVGVESSGFGPTKFLFSLTCH